MENSVEFKNILSSVNRPGISDLLNWIENETDFYEAPASTKYHCDYKGGLVKHSLNVYTNMVKLVEDFLPSKLSDQEFMDSVKVVSLLHDLSKVNFYEVYYQNRKLYTDSGSKRDEAGRFDWATIKSYKIKEPDTRFVAGDHGFNSYWLASKYIDFSTEEASAILNHHAGMDNNFMLKDLNFIYTKYTLASLLHLSDMISVYITETDHE